MYSRQPANSMASQQFEPVVVILVAVLCEEIWIRFGNRDTNLATLPILTEAWTTAELIMTMLLLRDALFEDFKDGGLEHFLIGFGLHQTF